MKIYTYYDQVADLPCQTDLIELWRRNWLSRGFEPVVLNDHDARKHPRYEEYVDYIRALHLEIKGDTIQPYGLSCYLRWLAYAVVSEPLFVTSDYDVLNFSLDVEDVEPDIIHLMCAATPCLVTGTPELFDRFTCMFVETMVSKIDDWRGTFKENTWLNDQEFLARCLLEGSADDRSHFMQQHQIKMNLDWGKYVENYNGYDTKNTHPCVHYAHHALHEALPIIRDDQSMDSIRKFEKFLDDYNIGFHAGYFTNVTKLTDLKFDKEINWSINYQTNVHRMRLLIMNLDIETHEKNRK